MILPKFLLSLWERTTVDLLAWNTDLTLNVPGLALSLVEFFFEHYPKLGDNFWFPEEYKLCGTFFDTAKCQWNFNTRVSQFELNYWNKRTFPRHSNLLRCTWKKLCSFGLSIRQRILNKCNHHFHKNINQFSTDDNKKCLLSPAFDQISTL